MVPVERTTMDFLTEENIASNKCPNSWTRDKANEFLEQRRVIRSGCPCAFSMSSSIVLLTKLPSHNLDALWCVLLPSHDGKSMLNLVTFLQTAVPCFSIAVNQYINTEMGQESSTSKRLRLVETCFWRFPALQRIAVRFTQTSDSLIHQFLCNGLFQKISTTPPPPWTTLNWVPKNFRISKKGSSSL